MAPPAINPTADSAGQGGLRTRVISALVLAPVALGLTYLGGAAFNGMLLIVAALMAYEWNRICRGSSSRKRPLWLAAGLVYIAVPCIAMSWLRATPETGLAIILWLLAVIWGTDIGAYFAGRGIGGPKLAPRISPKKTWAGLAGGMIAAGVVGAVTAAVLDLPGTLGLIAFSMALAVVAQGGDLVESAVKRHFKVKDSGTIIPGHGGLLDRLDGLLTAAPAVAAVALMSGEGVLAWR
jgi:phosphatidate cytidylyltransferase